MKRAHRRWHRALWMLLGPLAVVLVALAWTARQEVPAQPPLNLDAADALIDEGAGR